MKKITGYFLLMQVFTLIILALLSNRLVFYGFWDMLLICELIALIAIILVFTVEIAIKLIK